MNKNQELLEGLTVGQAQDYLKNNGVTKMPASENALLVAYDIIKRKNDKEMESKTTDLQEMLKNFDLDSFEQGYFKSGYHKNEDPIITIKNRINELRRHMGNEKSQPHCFSLMHLALIIRNKVQN